MDTVFDRHGAVLQGVRGGGSRHLKPPVIPDHAQSIYAEIIRDLDKLHNLR